MSDVCIFQADCAQVLLYTFNFEHTAVYKSVLCVHSSFSYQLPLFLDLYIPTRVYNTVYTIHGPLCIPPGYMRPSPKYKIHYNLDAVLLLVDLVDPTQVPSKKIKDNTAQ